MAPSEEKKRAAKEVIDLLEELAILLNTGLTRAQLSLCVSMIENGVNPEALATIIKELRRDGLMKDAQSDSSESV